MGTFSRPFHYVVMLAGFFSGSAGARLPEKRNEPSLQYWRYLCREDKQEETEKDGIRELKCLGQNWAVKTKAGDGVVKEIIENVSE